MTKLLDAARAALELCESIAADVGDGDACEIAERLRAAIAEEGARNPLAGIGRSLNDAEKQAVQEAIDDHRKVIEKHWPKAGLTVDSTDPRLGRGADEKPRPQNEVYLVLSDEERAKGFVRPYRDAYRHKTCGAVTSMGRELSETYAVNPKFYGSTYCTTCRMHKPVSEFLWAADGEEVGS